MQSMRSGRGVVFAAVLGIMSWVATSAPAAFTIQFDTTYDTSSFFTGNATAMATLNAAGDFFEGIIGDDLDAITPGGGNTWDAIFNRPDTGASTSLTDLSIAADTILVFVGARDLGGSTLGLAGPGGWSASGTGAWLTTVDTRGEGTTSGGGATDFGPWGGTLAIDSDGGSNWNFDHTTSPSSGEDDLYSVILHELGHVLGIGTADSWDNLLAAGPVFTGSDSVAEYGGNVPVDGGLGHWADGTSSDVYSGGAAQETAMDPVITVGTRKLFTDLDVAALSDVGWEVPLTAVVPAPSSLMAGLGLMGLVVLIAHRRSA